MKKLFCLLLLLLCQAALADQITVRVVMPETMCDGVTPLTGIGRVKLYVSADPIPYDDTYDCVTDGSANRPEPPSGFAPVTAAYQSGDYAEVIIDLTPGVKYYFRASIETAEGVEGALGLQEEKVIPISLPGSPTIIILGD